MIIGYGYPEDKAFLAAQGCEKVYIDFPSGDRSERGKMLRPGAIREGDTLVMTHSGRIGRGRAIPVLTAKIESMGVTVDIREPEMVNGVPGRKPIFNPDPKQDARIRKLWHSAYNTDHVVEEAGRIMGWEVKRHHLTHKYKARF